MGPKSPESVENRMSFPQISNARGLTPSDRKLWKTRLGLRPDIVPKQ